MSLQPVCVWQYSMPVVLSTNDTEEIQNNRIGESINCLCERMLLPISTLDLSEHYEICIKPNISKDSRCNQNERPVLISLNLYMRNINKESRAFPPILYPWEGGPDRVWYEYDCVSIQT